MRAAGERRGKLATKERRKGSSGPHNPGAKRQTIRNTSPGPKPNHQTSHSPNSFDWGATRPDFMDRMTPSYGAARLGFPFARKLACRGHQQEGRAIMECESLLSLLPTKLASCAHHMTGGSRYKHCGFTSVQASLHGKKRKQAFALHIVATLPTIPQTRLNLVPGS
jgi:hypothetical protein